MIIGNKKLHAEIQEHISLGVEELVGSYVSDLHYELFNVNLYIIGYANAQQWLDKHNVSVWECIEFVQIYEREHFGQNITPINSERMVNMLVYIIGEIELSECLTNLGIDQDDTLTNEHVEMIQDYFDL